ncbi:MAG: hypothetical protein ACKO8G_03235 [Actinomycetota bacterium]
MRRFYAALAVATMVATAYMPATAGPGNKRPTEANAAAIAGPDALDVAVDGDSSSVIEPAEWVDVTGTIVVHVDQVLGDPSGYGNEPIVAMEVRLPADMQFVPADELLVTVAGADGDGCSDDTATWSAFGGVLSIKSFVCANSGDDTITEFDVTISEDNGADRIGQSAISVVDTYDIELQYRTNGNRREKSYTWRYVEADAISITEV